MQIVAVLTSRPSIERVLQHIGLTVDVAQEEVPAGATKSGRPMFMGR